jgi:hypothetical protein
MPIVRFKILDHLALSPSRENPPPERGILRAANTARGEAWLRERTHGR